SAVTMTSSICLSRDACSCATAGGAVSPTTVSAGSMETSTSCLRIAFIPFICEPPRGYFYKSQSQHRKPLAGRIERGETAQQFVDAVVPLARASSNHGYRSRGRSPANLVGGSCSPMSPLSVAKNAAVRRRGVVPTDYY